MSPQLAYAIIYASTIREHLRFIDKKYHTLIQNTILERLSHEPLAENRNRKPLRRSALAGATWEIRFGPDNMFRVYYDVPEDRREVHILAIGSKIRNTVFIGGEEITL